jgi:hypothetical protein
LDLTRAKVAGEWRKQLTDLFKERLQLLTVVMMRIQIFCECCAVYTVFKLSHYRPGEAPRDPDG